MNAFARQWDARIAPIDEPLLGRFDGELVRESFEPWSFQGYSRKTVPVLINHDPDLHIGYVDLVMQRDGWHEASFRLDRSLLREDDAAELVRVGMPVSVGCRSFTRERDGINLRHRVCSLQEISLVGAGMKPGYKGAEIIRSMEFLERTKPKPAARAAAVATPAAADEVIYGGRVIRREFPALITFRGVRGEVIRNEPDGSQTIWASEADYRADGYG